MSLYVNFGVPMALFPVSYSTTPSPFPQMQHVHWILQERMYSCMHRYLNCVAVFLNSTLQREPYGCPAGGIKKPTNQHKESERQGETTFFNKKKR